MRLPYPTVSYKQPFLYIDVKHARGLLVPYVAGTTQCQLMVWRVRKRGGPSYVYQTQPVVTYTPPLAVDIKTSSNGYYGKFTFVLDTQVFSQPGGRFMAALQYNGSWIGRMEFIHEKHETTLDNQHPEWRENGGEYY